MTEPTITDISIKRKLICRNCAGIEGEGYGMCPIYCTMEELFGGTPDDMFCPFFDTERGMDHDAEPPDFTNEQFHQLTVSEIIQNGCEDG